MATNQLQQSALRQQLTAYLDRAVEVCVHWTSWLAEYQQAMLAGDFRELDRNSEKSEELFGLLKELSSKRAELLSSAVETGIKSSDAKGISRALARSPANDDLRFKIRLAELQMAQLRRLAQATWIVVSQCARITDETLTLMSLGKAESSVYIASPMADNCGGFLLDAQV